MKKKRWLILMAGMMLLGMMGVSSAALSERDYLSQGDGFITLDDTTGLQWLDLTQTRETRPIELSGTLGADGWRIATTGEVQALAAGYLGSASEIENFVMLFGTTYDENGAVAGSVSWGRFLDGNTGTSMDGLIVRDDSFSFRFVDSPDDSQPFSFSGTFFVRQDPSPVPLPSALWLLGSGLLSLVCFKRRP